MSRASARLFSLTMIVYLLAWAAGFAFVDRVFGLGYAMVLSLITAFPLFVGARMRHRWPTVRARELALLAFLMIFAAGSSIGVVQNWYATGMDRRHAEDLQFAEFGRALSKDPLFRDIKIHLTDGKNIHWVSGTVASKADLDRLNALANRCGISGRLDGPSAYSVSIEIEAGSESR